MTGIALLGPVAIRAADEWVGVPGPRARALLTALALDPGHPCSPQSLISDIWGSEPPRSPANALHTQVSRLRSALPEGALEVTSAGYRLTVARNQVDLARAEDEVRAFRRTDVHPRDVLTRVTEALSLWRGSPGADVVGPAGEQLAERAQGLRDELVALRLRSLLEVGDFAEALPLAREAHADNPFDDAAAGNLMRALAGSDRVSEALEMFAVHRERLGDRLGVDPSPALVALNADLLGAAATPVRSSRAIGLRAAPNAMFGRRDDIDNLESLLERSRVVTILGPGGAGKTRLAHELGSRAAARTSVALVELASLRSSDDVIAAIGSTLGISEADLAPGRLTVGRTHSARERLVEALSAGPMTLILDNCEHVIAACADIVAEMIAASALLTVLATSRSPLMLSAEVVYPLPPLEIHGDSGSAVELFAARARAVRPSVHLDLVAVGVLCATLDGLPLAIELAAARVRTMSVEEISARLSDRFALLRSGDPTSPVRHRTLHAVIDWSWNLLGTEHRVALARLCRFPAGFTLASARAVAEWDGVGDVADAIEALVNQSLLTVVDGPNGLRYHMLETVREYGEEKLAELGEGAEVVLRLNDWAVAIAEDARMRIRSDQVRLVGEIDAEHDNLLAVLRWAVDGGDATTTASVFPVLGMLWSIRGAHTEVSNWAPKVMEATRDHDLRSVTGDLAATTFILVAMHLLFGELGREHARARVRLRKMLHERDDLRPIFVFFIRLLNSPRSGYGVARLLADGVRSADIETRTAALFARSNLRENIGDVRGAHRDAEDLLRYAREIGDEWGVAMAAQHVGSIHSQSTNYGEAVEYYALAVAASERLGAHDEALQLIGFQASALIANGDSVGGRALLDELRPAVAQISANATIENHQRRAALLANLAEADLADGNVELGLRQYREALNSLGGAVENIYGDPFVILLSAAAVCAHAQAGQAAKVTDHAHRMIESSLIKLHPNGYTDLPLTGSVAAAVGAYDLSVGNLGPGTELLALAVVMRGRQDFATLQHARLTALASEIVGEEQWLSAVNKVSRYPRAAIREAVLDALRGSRA
ncbi:BTAD domain-containing putative transcriptional regulator [Rhodococcus sp. NPDC056743]|uniref:BTAD domain-containing putative transcriptional regulator n=1 Tax=Rhodococcus sp. NPDC056743 TaxID=3345934 RepID=UPI00366D26D5